MKAEEEFIGVRESRLRALADDGYVSDEDDFEALEGRSRRCPTTLG